MRGGARCDIRIQQSQILLNRIKNSLPSVKYRTESLIRVKFLTVTSEIAAAIQIQSFVTFEHVQDRRSSAGNRHPDAWEGSFALAYPLSRQSRAGIGDRRERNCPICAPLVTAKRISKILDETRILTFHSVYFSGDNGRGDVKRH
jgi:hypothetical protein